jgi:fibronectin-binding autotransporter adhesin
MARSQLTGRLYVCVLAALAAAPLAHGQTYNGPFTGTVNWSAGTWVGGLPAVGGSATTDLVFNQLGAGTVNAANDRGNPFVLRSLTFNSAGGGLTVSNAAGNTLEFQGAATITQSGIGNAVLSSTATLTATTTTITGSGFGNLQLSGVLGGGGGIVINRTASYPFTQYVDLTAANTYGGGTTLTAGNLRVGNATALGTGALTINGGTVGATTATTIGNGVVLGAADFVYGGTANLTLTGAITEGGTPRGLTLLSNSATTLILQGANTYSGPTLSDINHRMSNNSPAVGSLTFSGANGSALNSSSFTFNGGGTLTLDNSVSGANNDNRIGNSAPIVISGGTFVVNGANGGATLENGGQLSGRGSVFVTMNAGTAGNTGTTLQLDGLTRLDRGQFLFRGNNATFGSALGANVANLLFDTAPALSGGGGAAGTTTISIIPFAVGGITTTSLGTDFVTYGAANGVRPLAVAEYATTITSGATTTDNVKLAAAQVIAAPTTVNALAIATTTPFTGSTSTLTVTSGAVLVNSAAAVPAEMTLAFGGAEAVIHNTSAFTFNGILTGSNGLTKNGTSALVLTNPGNTISGTLTLNQGTVNFTDAAVIGSLTDVRVNGRSATSTPGFNFTPTTGSATINKATTVTDGFVQLLSGGGTLTYAGAISGPGGVLINGGNVELTNAANSYAGRTRVFGGNLVIGSDAVLGSGNGGVDIGALSTSGLRLSGDWTTSREINLSFSSQLDTNGFTWTQNSPLSGVAGVVNKVGAGAWVLTQAGPLGQSNVTGTLPPTTTINVNGGELRVTNATGSATGTATVSVGTTAAGLLTGTGQIAGATTIVATNGTINPGVGGTGTLTFGSTLTINGTYAATVTSSASDRVVVAGTLTLGTASTLDLTGGVFDAGTTYTLAQAGAVTGTFATTTGVPGSHLLTYSPTVITLVPVPEPATILLVASGAGLALARLRRRRA